jgi:hypothetical protein
MRMAAEEIVMDAAQISRRFAQMTAAQKREKEAAKEARCMPHRA